MSSDSNPQFTREFYTNIRILSQDLYKQRSTGTPAALTPTDLFKRRRTHTPSLSRIPSFSSHQGSTNELPSLAASKPTEDYFNTQSMNERIMQYARHGGIPMEFLDRYSQEISVAKPTVDKAYIE